MHTSARSFSCSAPLIKPPNRGVACAQRGEKSVGAEGAYAPQAPAARPLYPHTAGKATRSTSVCPRGAPPRQIPASAHLAQQRRRRRVRRSSAHVLRGPTGAARANAQRWLRLVALAVARRRADALQSHRRQERLSRLHSRCDSGHVAQRRRLPQRGRVAVAHRTAARSSRGTRGDALTDAA